MGAGEVCHCAGREPWYLAAVAPWSTSAVWGAVFIAAHYLFLRGASGRLNDALGALILEGTAAAALLVMWLMSRSATDESSMKGVLLSAASGVCISGAAIMIFRTLRLGGPVAATGTIIMGGGVAISALLAPWLFAEAFTLRRGAGVMLGLAAMALLASDKQ